MDFEETVSVKQSDVVMESTDSQSAPPAERLNVFQINEEVHVQDDLGLWWPCTITACEEDGKLRLKWRDWAASSYPPFVMDKGRLNYLIAIPVQIQIHPALWPLT